MIHGWKGPGLCWVPLGNFGWWRCTIRRSSLATFAAKNASLHRANLNRAVVRLFKLHGRRIGGCTDRQWQRSGLPQLSNGRDIRAGLPGSILSPHDCYHANGSEQQARSPDSLSRHRQSPSTDTNEVYSGTGIGVVDLAGLIDFDDWAEFGNLAGV